MATLTGKDVNPLGIQHYVVERIVKSDEFTVHHLSAQCLRPFSEAHEVDYDTWSTGVELLLNDPAASDLQ